MTRSAHEQAVPTAEKRVGPGGPDLASRALQMGVSPSGATRTCPGS